MSAGGLLGAVRREGDEEGRLRARGKGGVLRDIHQLSEGRQSARSRIALSAVKDIHKRRSPHGRACSLAVGGAGRGGLEAQPKLQAEGAGRTQLSIVAPHQSVGEDLVAAVEEVISPEGEAQAAMFRPEACP